MTPLDSIIMWLGQFLGVSGEPYQVVFVALIFWIFLFIFFARALKGFTGFSNPIAVLISLLLSFLAIFLGILSPIILPLVNLLGFMGATLLILFIFVGYLIIQGLIDKKLKEDKKYKKKFEIEIGKKAFQEFGKRVLSKKK